MDLLIDTCSWIKFDYLQDKKIVDTGILYQYADVAITHEVLAEIGYFKVSSVKIDKTKILPIKNNEIYISAMKLMFDRADASILSNGSRDSSTLIVSEDRALLTYATIHRFTCVQLIDLFRILTETNLISRNKLLKLSNILRKLRNITKRKEKSIKEWLQKSNP